MKILKRIPIVQAYSNRNEPESLRALADMYWKSILILSSALLIVFVAYNLWQFQSVSTILAASQQQNEKQNPLDVMPFKKDEIKAITETFIERQKIYQTYSTQAPIIADPSK